MVDFVNSVDILSDDVVTASIIDGSIVEYRDNVITTVGMYALYARANLTSVDFPAVTSVGNNAFYGCNNLTTVNFPAVTSIDINAFQNCSYLTTVNFPVVTSVGNSAFNGCSTLTSVDLPAATKIGQSAFNGCNNLTTVDIPKVNAIDQKAFNGCNNLTALILRHMSNKLINLSNANALSGTPIASGTGYIYLPSSFVDTYKSRSNWSTYAAQFRALEDYTVDGTVTGELDPNKI